MPNPPPSAKVTKGPLHNVPCPHCGTGIDCRDLQETYGTSFEPGMKIDCDHCGRHMQVTAVQSVTIVTVRQVDGHTQRAGNASAPQQKPGFLATLFGPPKR